MSTNQSRNTGTDYKQYDGVRDDAGDVSHADYESNTGKHWLGRHYPDIDKAPKKTTYERAKAGGNAKAWLGNSIGVMPDKFDAFAHLEAMDDPKWGSSFGTGPGSLDDENFPHGSGSYTPSTNAGARDTHTARPDDRSGQGNPGFSGLGGSRYTQYPQGTGRSTQGQNHGDDGIKKEDEDSEGDVDDKSALERGASSARYRRI